MDCWIEEKRRRRRRKKKEETWIAPYLATEKGSHRG